MFFRRCFEKRVHIEYGVDQDFLEHNVMCKYTRSTVEEHNCLFTPVETDRRTSVSL